MTADARVPKKKKTSKPNDGDMRLWITIYPFAPKKKNSKFSTVRLHQNTKNICFLPIGSFTLKLPAKHFSNLTDKLPNMNYKMHFLSLIL